MLNKTVAFHNLGCKVNGYETEAMQQLLETEGYTIVPFGPGADVYIINTCSVTNIADRKSRQMLHRAKKMNPDAVVVAVGCYVQTASAQGRADGDADILVGNAYKSRLPEILAEWFAGGKSGNASAYVTDMKGRCEYDRMQIRDAGTRTRAFVKVQDGCDQFCSYCVIPYARGRIRSRSLEDIRAEIKHLAECGVHEFVLTGIHLSSYGRDEGSETGLIGLIRETGAMDGVHRLRLGSLEPRIVDDDFAAQLAKIPSLCPHFHLSLQSGSDTVLQRMNRRYTAAGFEQACDCLRRAFDRPALTTDVIVGFPGEKPEEFEQTRKFLEKIRFYETHIFRYSMRRGTRAALMPNQITERVKAERSDILIRLGEENKKAYELERAGSPCEFLAEEKEEIDGTVYFSGYTREYIRVLMKAPENSGEDMAGRLLQGTYSFSDKGCIFTPIVLK